MVLLNNGALAEKVSGYERASPWQLPTSALHDYHGGVPTGSSLKSPYMMTEAQSVQQWVFKNRLQVRIDVSIDLLTVVYPRVNFSFPL